MFSPSVLRAASEITTLCRRRTLANQAGERISHRRGHGMQFREFRAYEPGDEIRHISWAVTARTGKTTVKVYDEEHEANVIVFVDKSLSSWDGRGRRKYRVYQDILSTLGLAAEHLGNPFGVAVYDEKLKSYYPPQKKRFHWRQALNEVAEQGKGTSLLKALHEVMRRLGQRSQLYILSDFIDPKLSEALAFASLRHAVTLISCTNTMEQGELQGIETVFDPEIGRPLLLDGGSRFFINGLKKVTHQHKQWIKRLARQHHCDSLELNTDEDYLHTLVRYFGAPNYRSR